MCKVGDIIVVNKYIGDDGKEIKRHSFVVIDDNHSEIGGLDYDFVSCVMSSFKDEEHRKRKLSFEENIEITSDDIISETANNKSGYIKADQLFYFDKNKLDYYVFASVEPDLLDELIRIIIHLQVKNKLKQNTKNLQQTESKEEQPV